MSRFGKLIWKVIIGVIIIGGLSLLGRGLYRLWKAARGA